MEEIKIYLLLAMAPFRLQKEKENGEKKKGRKGQKEIHMYTLKPLFLHINGPDLLNFLNTPPPIPARGCRSPPHPPPSSTIHHFP